jgi:RHS repeat-associated protein
MDLAGDGQPDLVALDGPIPGLYEHDGAEGWQPFSSFTARLNRDTRDPNLKFVDLNGDGHSDVLITEDGAFVWHPSLAEEGFGPAQRVYQALDEEKGPRLIFADGTQSIHLADMCGDGLTDLVRIRNGEVCYWPNLGYGRFGAKVTMDHAPWFDAPDQFDHKRIRLADIDGTETTDIIYLHRDGVRLYFNQSGNSWSAPKTLSVFPRIDDLASITAVDLLGNGTACLVWSSPMPGDARRQMRYVNLMGGQKPHLLIKTVNNLGAKTRIHYAPSTKFYLADKRDGKPWITRLPFPVHVVERVETYDHISRNRFVTRYEYHHGYFDGEEREFRGFGMVEQRDTEEFTALTDDGTLAKATNFNAASHVPPVLTRTWFHTGVYLDREHVSRQFEDEYYREPCLSPQEFRAQLLPDTTLPIGLTLEEEREACRALKGMMLRQEVYANDAPPGSSDEMIQRASTPYTVVEQDFTIRTLQPRGGNRHAVFFTHAREAISYHYERNPADPRVQHALTLEVDAFGNVLKQAAIGYGRRKQIRVVEDQGNVQQVPNPGLTGLNAIDQAKQTTPLLTYTENRVTKDHDTGRDAIDRDDDYRVPLPCEALTFELTDYTPTGEAGRFQASDLVEPDPGAAGRLRHKFTDQVSYEAQATGNPCRRPIEWMRTIYRRDDLNGLLPLGELHSFALPGESYKLAFTPGLLTQVFQRDGQPLLPTSPATVLGGAGPDQGGYVDLDGDGRWWIPSGRVFLSPDSSHTPGQELSHARQHFFLPHRYRDPFGQTSTVLYDGYDLLLLETQDPLSNRVTVGERLPDDSLASSKPGNDYRVLQPRLVMDPNRNRTEVAFDALGLVAGAALKGKPEDNPQQGDFLDASFTADLPDADIDAFYDAIDPHVTAESHLETATTRIIYDLSRFYKTRQAFPKEPEKWEPVFAATLARETHVSDLGTGEKPKIQISFSYSDGFGREIQKKIQAEPETSGGPPRWVGSGWTVFNNMGKPVRQYEPFFSQLPDEGNQFEFGVEVGVGLILFYDPVQRVVATLHPNHTYEKVVFDPWQQTTWDVNDTLHPPLNLGGPPFNPQDDPHVGEFFRRLPQDEYLPTWYDLRMDAVKAMLEWPDTDSGGQSLPGNASRRTAEKSAAAKASAHADTPAVAYLDSLGRPFMTIADNGPEGQYATRVELNIEGNQRAVKDERRKPDGAVEQRIVMRYDYDMLGTVVHQASMEAGERWTLNNVAGNPIRRWDSRGHTFRTLYDPLQRPTHVFIQRPGGTGVLVERLVYGEAHSDASRNLRGQLYQHYDGAGAVANERFDFKGNPLEGSRQLAKDHKHTVDWSLLAALTDPHAIANAALHNLDSDNYFISRTAYDALNRPVMLVTPHNSAVHPNVVQATYNEANLLEKVDVWLRRAAAPTQPLDPAAADLHAVANIDYDAKGQRMLIKYGNGAKTRYSYDPKTFRLTNLKTTRPSTFAPDQRVVQDLAYTYDPVGNITHIQDDADIQNVIYFNNRRVEPSADYEYDALYRLVKASGREHLGQNSGTLNTPRQPDHDDSFQTKLPHPHDGNAMGNYTEHYQYDAVGNILKMVHQTASGSWTRYYAYDEPSLIESGKVNNRLSSTSLPGDDPLGPYRGKYGYRDENGNDVHGCITRMPHLPLMRWDYRDQLQATSQQVVNDRGSPEITYYTYDSSGQRVRKVTESAVTKQQAENGQAPTRMKERIYLDNFEIYREYQSDGVTKKLERETLHVMDDQQRIALVETRTLPTTPDPNDPIQLIRYQLGNHLGSASVELAEDGALVSYEEYHPYGTTAFQAGRSAAEVSLKRYRYTGKERDEESGLYYHGARYYVPWLGTWMSCDPASLASLGNYSSLTTSGSKSHDDQQMDLGDGGEGYPDSNSDAHKFIRTEETNLYCFVRNNPLVYLDPDGAKEVFVGTVYEITGEIGGAPVRYVGSSAQELRARFSKHDWKSLITAKSTAIHAYDVYADLDVQGSGRGSFNSARNEALRSVEQKVLNRGKKMAKFRLNTDEAATQQNARKWMKQHKPRMGAQRLIKSPGSNASLGVFAGLQIYDAYKMTRDLQNSKYGSGTWVFRDAQGEFTVGWEGNLFYTDYYKVYISEESAGNKVEISWSEYRNLGAEGEALYGYLDWSGEFIPGLLNRELPVVPAPPDKQRDPFEQWLWEEEQEKWRQRELRSREPA